MPPTDSQALVLPDAEVVFYPAFFPADTADRLLREIVDTTAWEQKAIKLF